MGKVLFKQKIVMVKSVFISDLPQKCAIITEDMFQKKKNEYLLICKSMPTKVLISIIVLRE